MEGLLLIDKPSGITSHQVIDVLRDLTGISRIGHTGTLDPLATGLLVCCLGRATRIAEYLTRAHKVYEGEMVLGVTSDTYDTDGQLTKQDVALPTDEEVIAQVFQRFVGLIEQQVPRFAAVKVNGKKLYEYARAGEDVESPKRMVQIKFLNLVNYDPPYVKFQTKVSSGTYIRTLCHDTGEMLECGAYLSALRRLEVG